jgi:nucleoside-diphosphate-sugar epimerase
MNTRDKSVLVTGAGGFIGSHLVERLVHEGAHVRAFVHYNSRNDWGNLELVDPEFRREIEVVTGDVADPFSVRKAARNVRVIYHLSSLIAIPYSYVAPQSYVTTNIQGAINVLQAARDEGVDRVVHTSTSECYGTALYVPIDERHALQGQSPYSASKIGADMIAESYWRSFGLPVAILRPFNTFGPRQSARAVIPTIISQALKGGTDQTGIPFSDPRHELRREHRRWLSGGRHQSSGCWAGDQRRFRTRDQHWRSGPDDRQPDRQQVRGRRG